MKNSNRLLLNSVLLILLAASTWADEMNGGNYTLIKDVLGTTGNSTLASADFTLAFAWGEPASAGSGGQAIYTILSGYFGGGFGNGLPFTVMTSQIGLTGGQTYRQNSLPVGLPYTTPVQIKVSDQLDESTLPSSVQASVLMDHLGVAANANTPITITSDPATQIITITPSGAWTGNTLYDIQLTPKLLSVDGFPLDQTYHLYFQTVLDPHQDNVVQEQVAIPGAAAAGVNGTGSAMSIYIPTNSLPDYSTILTNKDPMAEPLHVDPSIIRDANTKARLAGGSYRTPIAIQEITAFDTKGNIIGSLSAPARITVNYGSANAASSYARPQTLSLWVLDEAHRLWVKIPASQNSTALQTVSAPVPHFSVYALIGSPEGSASDSFAFPVPWRPHGPNAGTAPGQSGLESDGITFSNLPSECTIKIYTIAGDLVRQLNHTDIGGLLAQEKWDVKTTHGESVASGVYLWRVESSVDGKNGKLMVIR